MRKKLIMDLSTGKQRTISLSSDEEIKRDAEEAKWEAEKPKRLLNEIREKRNKLLSESDWVHFPDVKLSESKKEAWNKYRQLLRDIPQSFKNPGDIKWPEKPE
tara:strand:+ start:12157 stop:12465 length:309 start_codon:yes stop_codon:yes gene_type:complete